MIKRMYTDMHVRIKIDAQKKSIIINVYPNVIWQLQQWMRKTHK